jgi:hypothetical protein
MRTHHTLIEPLLWLVISMAVLGLYDNASAQTGDTSYAKNRKTSETAPQFRPITPNAATASHSPKPIQLLVLGQPIVFINPVDYCTVGDSIREKDLVDSSSQILGNTVRLVHFAVRCNELQEYRNGKRKTLDHWMQIHLIGNKGDFKRLEVPRDAFLKSVSSIAPKLDMDEIKDRINLQIQELNLDVSSISMRPIGRDGNALYMASRSTIQSDDKAKLISAIGGITLINSLPLSVWIYEVKGTQKSHSQLHLTLQQSITNLITQN